MKHIIMIFIALFVVAACTTVVTPPEFPSPDGASQELQRFSSLDELKEFLDDAQTAQNINFGMDGSFGRGVMMAEMDMAESAPMPVAPTGGQLKASSGDIASDYSETNVQVKGVDESDFVKNDGKHIYVLSRNLLTIVDAFPAEDAKILSETAMKGNGENMFVKDDRLVVFTSESSQVNMIAEYDFVPRPRYTTVTKALLYDISDREDPQLIRDYTLNGDFFQARMIDDYVYFIVKENVYHYDNFIDVPEISSKGGAVMAPEIYYFDNPERDYVFHTVASFDINQEKTGIEAKAYLMGYSNVVYVSQDNIYITYQKNIPYDHYQELNKERFYDIILPLLPDEVKSEIESIGSSDAGAWNRVSAAMEQMYERMDEDDVVALLEKIADAVEEYDAQIAQERERTIIHKINIDKGRINYDTKGEVPGDLLNQFSLDEDNGYLRVATTTQFWTRDSGRILHNNVLVLDDDLDVVGSIEKIAPGESIYSTRFIGDRLYLVTFERIDPLFVIDLSKPTDPEILGELKIPGFSDYLHPYDENHIIGIGKETAENEWGGISIKGVKLSLFDVTDVNNPKQIDSVEIGSRGTDSEALREHKAFLFDREKDLLVIPIREVLETDSNRPWRQRIWQGAYVFSLSPEKGFTQRGKISHATAWDENYWGSADAVRRSLYMDDVLYTISSSKIKMNDLGDLDMIKELDLSYSDLVYPKYGVPMIEPAVEWAE
ncbi:MAG: beta-propeller domain-containing protein [Nanoarchaeota archaeon]